MMCEFYHWLLKQLFFLKCPLLSYYKKRRGNLVMTKAELVAVMAQDAGISKAATATVLDSYVKTVAKELKKNGKLGLVGFGTFSVVKRKARTGRNPQTGEEIKIKAKKVVRFKPGKGLSDKVQ
jgi:DNA-binding protein HU-beta